MIEIVPAILEKSLAAIEAKLALVAGASRRVQIDIIDGRYARAPGFWGKTWPYRDAGSWASVLAEKRTMPLFDKFDFEFDLMVSEPKARALEVAHAIASHVVIHARAPGALEALQALAGLKDEDYGAYSIKTGVALGPGEQPDLLNEFEGLYDYAQVMGIARVGRQGQPFDKRALALVERLRARNPALAIQVDGAVTLENAAALARAGANRLIVGHAVWEAEDSKAALAALQAEANRN